RRRPRRHGLDGTEPPRGARERRPHLRGGRDSSAASARADGRDSGDRRSRLMAIATVDHVISRDNVIWAFGPDLEPVLEVEPGQTVRIETNDCFTGQIQSED